MGGFVFVATTAVAQTQHTEQPLIHLVIRADCFFLGGFVFVAAAVVVQNFWILHILKEGCRHILKPNNEASLKSVQSSIHPVIRLFTATLNPSIYNNPKFVPSSGQTVFF
jgi:hypothetical protein